MPLRKAVLVYPDKVEFHSSTSTTPQKWISQKYDFQTITPLLGGSAVPGEIDPEHPVRGPTIRGHLRYWWRHYFQIKNPAATTKEIFLEEEKIWGSAAGNEGRGSQVKLSVEFTPQKMLVTTQKQLVQDSNFLIYSTYGIDKENNVLKDGLRFSVRLKLHRDLNADQLNSVTQAMRLWSSFGGIGAKTRKGFGAFKETSGLLAVIDKAEANSLGLSVTVSAKTHADAYSANKETLLKYHEYRQGTGVARNPGADPKNKKKPGQTRWPEADLIRKIYGHVNKRYSFKHPLRGLPERLPKAMFGLPINTEFKDEGSCDKKKFLISPKLPNETVRKERMASPLIFRPVEIDKQWHACVIKLPTPHLKKLQLVLHEEPSSIAYTFERAVWWSETDAEKDRAKIGPMSTQNSSDPLDNFIEYFSSTNK